MTTTLITGANKGLGYETARQLIDAGHTVFLGARDAARGRKAADELGATFVQVDVSDDESVARAVDVLSAETGHLDVLINNAGIAGPQAELTSFPSSAALDVLDTNVVGIVRMTNAFLPLLERSDNPRIVNVSSGLGSVAFTRDASRIEFHTPPLFYSATKAAVTMLTVQYARALPAMRVNAADPGFTATDLNGNQGTQSRQEGVVAIVRLAQLGTDGPSGTFQDRFGDAAF